MSLLAPSAPRAPEPRVIAQKYRLESLLGEGGMGSVWRAFNLQLEVPVAIKLLRPDLSNAELGERLRVEARAGAKLVHPSIVRVYDIGEAESGDPFIVMELLNGESLGSLLERGALPAVDALQILLPIAEGLSLAHSRGVVHRDLKPDNIFLATDGSALQPKLLDFGIAKVTSTIASGGATLTQTGTLLGSPDYMSPEQAYGRADIDQRSDVWSFCAMLYEALSGRPPFLGTSCQQVLRSVVEDEPVPLDVLGVAAPELSQIVMHGLVKDRDCRPGSIFELGQALAGWLMSQGVVEDVTGSSLEAKWFGRGHEVTSGAARALVAPRAQHDQATLMSVVHPSPRPPSASEPVFELPLRKRHKRAPAAVAAALAIGALGLGSWATLSRGLPTFTTASAPEAAPQLAAGASLVPAAVTPAEAAPAPDRALEPPRSVDSLRPQTKPATAPARRHAVQPPATTRTAALQNRELPRAALPRALPETHTDLINPY